MNQIINLQLDIWIPKYKLGFEYHGEQHFLSMFNQDMSLQYARDKHRRQICYQMGITLIEIPYWWDLKKGLLFYIINSTTKESLIASIIQLRPDLMQEMALERK